MVFAGRNVAMAAAALVGISINSGALGAALAYQFASTDSNGEAEHGALPIAGLTPGSAVLYGTASRGGNYDVNGYGGGVVFKLTPPASGKTTWTQTVLLAFNGATDGLFPTTGNLLSLSGSLYGTTNGSSQGLECGSAENESCDTVFKLAPPAAGKTAWTETVLARFEGGSDGWNPEGGLIASKSGVLYGTTAAGGNTGCQSSYTNLTGSTGCGTIYSLTPPAAGKTAWTKTRLHTFTGGADGGIPMAALIETSTGLLYGTASTGGTTDCSFDSENCGVVFELAPPVGGTTAWTEKVLYSFKGGADGLAPLGALIEHSGKLYGTAMSGGYGCNIYGCGTVFSLTPPATGKTAWTFKVIYTFTGGASGGVPQAGLVFDDTTQSLYGTTFQYGDTSVDCGRFVGCGTVFKLKAPPTGGTTWTESNLAEFNGGYVGGQSSASLLLYENALYGTAALGGSAECGSGIAPVCGGTVFKFAP
jgi:uncharacterized protein YceK